MERRYATSFILLPPHGVTPRATAKQVQAEVVAWMRQGATERMLSPPEVPADKDDYSWSKDANLLELSARLAADHALFRARCVFPDDEDPGVLWETRISIAEYAGVLEFTLVLSAGTAHRAIRPITLQVGRPRIVRTIVQKFHCTAGGRRLQDKPTTLADYDVKAFVNDQLVDPSRQLPLVVVAANDADPRINAEWIADRLVSHATVVRLADRYAGYELTRILTKPLACFNGAVRIYWPGFRSTDDPFNHPLYIPSLLAQERGLGARDIEIDIVKRISRLTPNQFEEGPTTKLARDRFLRDMAASAIKGKKVDDLVALAEKLRSDLEQKEHEVTQLSEELQNARIAYHEFERTHRDEAAGALSQVPKIDECTRLPQILAVAQFTLDRLVFYESAKKAAEESTTKHLRRAYDALAILNDFAEDYYAKKDQGKPLGKGFDDYFAGKAAPKFSPKESETTMNQFGAARIFSHNGRRRTMQMHFTIGGADDHKSIVQIYFDLDDASKSVHIGHVGPHLPISSNR